MQLPFSTALILAAFSAVATQVVAQQCPEASRFGIFSITPSTLSPGDAYTVNANFTCSNELGVNPQYTDYYIEVPVNNNGYEPPILLARRTLSTNSLLDQFTGQLPYAYYFANASYEVVLEVTYPQNGTNGSPYSVVGGISTGITITNI